MAVSCHAPTPVLGVRIWRLTLPLLLLAALGCGAKRGTQPIMIGLQSTFGDPLGLPLRYGAQLAAQGLWPAAALTGRSPRTRCRSSR